MTYLQILADLKNQLEDKIESYEDPNQIPLELIRTYFYVILTL